MKFRNEYSFLSNMYECSIIYKGITYKCVESAFQAQKDLSRVNEFAKLSGVEAKYLGRKVSLRPDWNEVKVNIMYNIVRNKFKQNPELAQKLKNISGPITEENTWNDTFWGVCNGRGKNILGKILTKIRSEI